MTERIQKMLATAGVASRREIERLIAEGRILVNGRPAELGQQINHDDSVRVDGKTIALQRKMEAARLLIYKKRVGELVTRDDPEGRRTVFRKLPELATGRWIAVGRLDINTSGLLLFTNHGELARRLTHPSFEIPRQYAARVLGTVDADVIARWKAGVELDDGIARFERVEASEGEDGEGANQWFHVTVREGRNRLVRRLIESQDLQVSRLIRLRYGPIELGRGMKSGTAREATPQELAAVLSAVKLTDEEAGLDRPKKRQSPERERRRQRDDDDDGASTAPRHSDRAKRASPQRREPAPRAARNDETRRPAPSTTRSDGARSPAARAQRDAASTRAVRADSARPRLVPGQRARPPRAPSRHRDSGPRAEAGKSAHKKAPRPQRREPASAAKSSAQAPRLTSANRGGPQRKQRPSSTRRSDSKPRTRK